jgi:hypothetical protein
MRLAQKHKNRRCVGNTMMLSMVVLMLLIAFGAVAFTFYSVFFIQRRLGERAEVNSLLASRLLNPNDRTGQFNNIVSASRQLVFNTRNTYNDVMENRPEVGTIADELMEESREGAKLVISERNRILMLTLNDIRDLKKLFEDQSNNQTQLILPWLWTDKASVTNLKVGYVTNLDSNVLAPVGNPGLMTLDTKFIDKQTGLYYGNVPLKLASPDADLPFNLSALPSPVNGTIAALRVAGNERFTSSMYLIKDGQPGLGACQFFPCAVQLTLTQEIKSSFRSHNTIEVSATSITNGASPMP